MKVKELFDKAENGVLTWAQFEEAAKAAGAKFTDLSEGQYVAKNKYDDEIASRDNQINTLNDTIASRDTDLSDLKAKLEAAGADTSKLAELTTQFGNLQSKYDTDTKTYKEQLKKQAYEFAVKDFANGKKFTSQAAKRDFIQSMIAKELKMEKDSILGADDFVTAYTKDNADAFVAETPPEDPKPTPKPTFVTPTPGSDPTPPESNAFTSAFNFVGVRPKQ